MKKIVYLVLLISCIACGQETYTNYPSLDLKLEQIKQEYIDNEIPNTRFHLLDTVGIKQLSYPLVGLWTKQNGYNNNIYMHPLILKDTLYLEYTLKHELGHMHGLEHDTIDPGNLMFVYFTPPENKEEWLKMNKKYYADLKKKLNPQTN